MTKKTLLSGVKPTGRPHIGNYFGALRQFVSMQDEFNAIYMIADYHALNFVQNKEEMSQNILDVAIDYLALGLDPQKSIIFKQSDVSEHTELTWIFDTITTMPYLMRAHAYKDAEANNKEISVGTFNYPMLMACDILLYDPDVVPVGQDQKQHVEYARDTAQKFNSIFKKDIFKLPESKILGEVAVVPGTDGQKMSKSYNNTIGLFATHDEITKAVMSIVTDSKGVEDVKDPETCNVFKLYKLFATKDEQEKLAKQYRAGGMGYGTAKEELFTVVERELAPLRENYNRLIASPDKLQSVLADGAHRARQIAQSTMSEIRAAIGVGKML